MNLRQGIKNIFQRQKNGVEANVIINPAVEELLSNLPAKPSEADIATLRARLVDICKQTRTPQEVDALESSIAAAVDKYSERLDVKQSHLTGRILTIGKENGWLTKNPNYEEDKTR